MPEDYKQELMMQIEEKNRKKEMEKKKRFDEELRDEERVKRELEELNYKYQVETGQKKAKKS